MNKYNELIQLDRIIMRPYHMNNQRSLREYYKVSLRKHPYFTDKYYDPAKG